MLSFGWSATGQTIITVAGNGGWPTDSGDGGLATAAVSYLPGCLSLDKFGNLYIGEANGGLRIRKVTPTGIISTVAGTGYSGFSGDGGPATNAKFDNIHGVCIDNSGNIYIADLGNHRVRKVDITSGIITTIVGTGVAGFSGDGGPATSAQINWPKDICIDKTGNLFIADHLNYRVRKVSPAGIITTVAGKGYLPPYTYGGDGGRADTTALKAAVAVCVDDTGTLYISDGLSRVMRVDTFGFISTYAGNGVNAVIGEGIPATAASTGPLKIALDGNSNLYLSENVGGHKVRKVGADGIITTVAGTGTGGYSGDDGPATAANLKAPGGVVIDTCGNLYIADSWNNRVRKVLFYPDCPDTSGGEGPTQAVGVTTQPTEISVFPNPVSDILYVTCSMPVAFSIAAISGREVASGTLTKGDNSIPVSHFPTGVYFINATSPSGERRVYKVVKE